MNREVFFSELSVIQTPGDLNDCHYSHYSTDTDASILIPSARIL